jgi:hypothetical protein
MAIIDRIDGELLSPSISKAALAWAERGVAVLAVHGISDGACDCGNPKCRSPGKHPIGKEFPRGHKSATTDQAKIRRVFRRCPNANLAIVPPPDHLVVDVDGEIGKENFAKLGLPETAYQTTGRGRHYHFHLKDGWPDKPPRIEGIDFKTASNGYAVVAPSTHISGKPRKWSRRHREVSEISVSELGSSKRKTIDMAGDKLTARAGSRNNTLASFAGLLRYRGLTGAALSRVLDRLNAEICEPPLESDEVRKIANSIDSYPSGADDAFMSLANVEEEEVQFLIYPYLVKGAVNVLDGDMGEGKSTFTAGVTSAVTTGRPPPFLSSIEQGDVLVLSAEDDAARALKPRMVKFGADVTRIRFQKKAFTLDDSGMALLRLECEQHRPLLIVIDPVIAYMGEDIDGNSANDTMRFIVKLDYLAREFDCCILLVRHFRKAKSDTPMHRGIGSIALSARVRSALMLGRHPDDENLRLVAHSKHNYSKKGPSLVFELRGDDSGRPPDLIWHDVDPDLNEYDIAVGHSSRGRPDKEREFARDFLLGILSGGPVLKSKVDAMARAKSIADMTLRRAAEELKIVKGKDGRKSTWALPPTEER